MIMQPCPACKLEDAVNEDGPLSETCTCEECGARFEIDADADYDDGWKDCSTVGKRIDHGED